MNLQILYHGMRELFQIQDINGIMTLLFLLFSHASPCDHCSLFLCIFFSPINIVTNFFFSPHLLHLLPIVTNLRHLPLGLLLIGSILLLAVHHLLFPSKIVFFGSFLILSNLFPFSHRVPSLNSPFFNHQFFTSSFSLDPPANDPTFTFCLSK